MPGNVVAYGVYLPKYRVAREEIGKAWGGRGTGEISVAWTNEDPYTMAAEAALNACRQSGIEPEKIEAFYFATTSSSYIEHSVVKAVTEVLRLKEEVEIASFNGTPQAGAAALRACQDALSAGRIKYGLVAAADSRPASPGGDEEKSFGAGAAALLLGATEGRAEMGNPFSASAYIIDSWRSTQDRYVKSADPRFAREYGYVNQIVRAAKGLMEKEGKEPGDYRYLVLQPHSDARVPRNLGRELGFKPEQMETMVSLYEAVGDLGAAAVLFGLAGTLSKAAAGEKILSVFYGSGIAEALSFTVKQSFPNPEAYSLEKYLASKENLDYLSFLKVKGTLEKDEKPANLWVSPLSPLWLRDGPGIRRLKGAKCQKCGYVNFPASGRKLCIRCGNQTFEEVLRARNGKIHTYCVNIYVPPGMESPLPVIVADLEDGTRYKALGTEFKLAELKIDLPVELVWRRAAVEEGANAYIYFFRPLR